MAIFLQFIQVISIFQNFLGNSNKLLEQGNDIESVAATEGTDFPCKPAQLVITKFIDSESKKELLSGLQHVRSTDLHFKLIDLDPNRGILTLFILPLTGKVRRNKNIFFSDLY